MANLQKKINEVKKGRTKHIQLIGEVLYDETLKDLQKQAGNTDDFDNLVMEIASQGGSVDEGINIMIWLDILSGVGKHVTTVVTANAYSIASLIMLAADERLISTHGRVMVHNPMFNQIDYANADELEFLAKDLRDLEENMYQMYEIFAGLDRETIKELMDRETYIPPHEAVKYGFADKVIKLNPKPYSMMANSQKQEKNMSKTVNLLNRIIAKINDEKIVNQTYYDIQGDTLEITQKELSTYTKGDTVDKKEGNFKLADGSTINVKDNKIVDITNEAPEEVVDVNEGDETVVEETEEVVENDNTIEETEEVSAVDDNMSEPDIESLKTMISEMISEATKELNDRIDVLEKSLVENKKGADEQAETFNVFEEKITEAIDVLATNTVSNFKPSNKSSEKKTFSGSIFNQAKQKRQNR